MSETASIDKRFPKLPTQQRSRERFEYILDCAEALLDEKSKADDVSIYEVAERAELQAQSVYRLFPSATAIVFALAQRYLNLLDEHIAAVKLGNDVSWQAAIELYIQESKAFYDRYPRAAELILGSSVSQDIRTADRDNVSFLAKGAEIWLEANASTGSVPRLQLEIMIDIIDAIWAKSYYAHGAITSFYLRESIRAATSYLELYLPRFEA